jgi:hypothetical protein
MSGRFTVPAAEVAELMGLAELPAFAPRYNIKPTTPILVVREVDGKRVGETPVWGFALAWSATRPVINATVEKVRARSPYWRAAVKHGRCLVPMSAGYEWQFAGTKKSIAHAFGVLPKHLLFAVTCELSFGWLTSTECPKSPASYPPSNRAIPTPPSGSCHWSTRNCVSWRPGVWPRRSRTRRSNPRPWFMRRICGSWGRARLFGGTIVAIFSRPPRRPCGAF